MSTVAMRKLLERIRSRYSRFAISQTLCIDSASCFCIAEACADVFDEDLFQRGFHDFKAVDVSTARDSLGENLLGGGLVVQLDLGDAGVVLRLGNTRVAKEGVVTGEDDLHAVARVARFDLA